MASELQRRSRGTLLSADDAGHDNTPITGINWGSDHPRKVSGVRVARPPLPVGTYGKIRFQRTAAGVGWRARTQVRDWDGRTRPVERTGRTRATAETRLKLAL